MLEEHLSSIFDALDSKEVRYLVVGGLAVVAHGHARFTADLDLVVALDDANTRRAVDALTSLGYRPSAPVSPMDFANPGTRNDWAEHRGMVVFQMVSDARPETCVDIFTTEPFDFDAEYSRAPRIELVEKRSVPVASLETLLSMKLSSGRPKDLDDVQVLTRIQDMDGPHIF